MVVVVLRGELWREKPQKESRFSGVGVGQSCLGSGENDEASKVIGL